MTESSKKIKQIRTNLNLSQDNFAKSLGFSKGYIADVESGRTKPSRNLLEVIFQRYGISIDWLFLKNRLLFLMETLQTTFIFAYAFSREGLDHCDRMLKEFLKDRTYIFVDALGIRSPNRLLKRILNEEGTTEELWAKLIFMFLTEEVVLIIKNMSLSKIPRSGDWIYSIFKLGADQIARMAEPNKISKLPRNTLIIIDYPSYLEKNMDTFGVYVDHIIPQESTLFLK
jgi:transcriptional regulator with XRE-family HTH domain